jgi:DNA polymerase-3 subunit beta
MKVRVERERLADAVKRASLMLPRITADPVGAAFRLTADHQGLRIAGFDGMAYTLHQVAAEVLEDDAMLVPGHAFVQVVDGLRGEYVELADSPHGLSVSCGPGHYIVRDLNHLRPPALPEVPEPSGTIAADVLTRAVRQVAPAADPNNAVAVLAAVQIVAEGRKLLLRASDRYRFAVAAVDWEPVQPGLDTSVICPVRHLVDAVHAVATEGDVTLCLPRDGQVQVGLIGRGAASLRMVEPPYIRTEALLGIEYDAIAEVDAAELRQAADRLQRLDKEAKRLFLELTADRITVSSSEGADASAFGREVLEDAYLEGPDRARIAINPRFLVDALAPIEGRARIHMAGWGKPVLLQAVDDEDAAYRNWILPLKDPWADPKNWQA